MPEPTKGVYLAPRSDEELDAAATITEADVKLCLAVASPEVRAMLTARVESVARYDAAESRDSDGRWTGDGFAGMFKSAAANAVGRLPGDTLAEYHRAFELAWGAVPSKAKARIESNVDAISLHKSTEDLGAAVNPQGGPTGYGCYTLRHLHLDGKPPSIPIAEMFAHELAHAWDGPALEYSAGTDWHGAWLRELSRSDEKQAKRRPFEGFAEFGRMVWVSDKADAAKKYPECYALWEKWGLI